VAHICSRRKIIQEKPEGKRLLKNLGGDGRIILKWSLREWNKMGGYELDSSGSE
jgi:hypothetical protein